MKKIMIVCVLLISSYALRAQTDAHFGLKGGLNVSNLKVGNTYLDSKTSAFGGAFFHIHLDRVIALQPEVMISGQGAQQVIDGTNRITSLTYMNVPVLVQYMFGDGFRLQTGPQAGMLLSARYNNGASKIDVQNSYKSGDFSWVFGGSYVSPSSGWGVDARYNLGLTNINEGATIVNNRVFQLGAIYQFKRHL